MAPHQCEHASAFLKRLEEPPARLILVSGPWQTGKTALARQALSRLDREHQYLSADGLGLEEARKTTVCAADVAAPKQAKSAMP